MIVFSHQWNTLAFAEANQQCCIWLIRPNSYDPRWGSRTIATWVIRVDIPLTEVTICNNLDAIAMSVYNYWIDDPENYPGFEFSTIVIDGKKITLYSQLAALTNLPIV